MFYNELEILKIRLEELYDIVDLFLIVEATTTHSGDEKPLYFTENKEMFSKYLDKIKYYVTDFKENFDFSNYIKAPNVNWYRENYQRECIGNLLKAENLDDNDIVIITDCDEIPKRSVIEGIRQGEIYIPNGVVFTIEMVLYYYNIELTTSRRWSLARLLTYGTFNNNFRLLTDVRHFGSSAVIKDAGYHLSYFGDVDFIKRKVESFAESIEYTREGKDIGYLKECFDKGILHFNKEKLIFIPLATNTNVPVHFLK